MSDNTSKIITQAIIVTGEDKFKFLQGQITADLDQLNKKDSILSAYCNRQGRVLSIFYIIKIHDNYVLLFLGDTAEIFLSSIKKYSVFSKINFSEILSPQDNNLDILNNKIILDTINHSVGYYIENRIPVITQIHSGEFLPDNLNLITLEAVSFRKGCFLGQEIIARVFYKGKNKKVLNIVDRKNLDQASSNLTVLIQNNQQALVVQDL